MMRAQFSSVLLTAFALALAPIAAAFAEPITDRAAVIDGDTLEIHGERIRLRGVDAPEERQLCRGGDCLLYRCGQQAANALAERIGADPISCEPSDIDQCGRTVAVCRFGAPDLNGWLVEEGFALAYRRYSPPRTFAKKRRRFLRGAGSGPASASIPSAHPSGQCNRFH